MCKYRLIYCKNKGCRGKVWAIILDPCPDAGTGEPKVPQYANEEWYNTSRPYLEGCEACVGINRMRHGQITCMPCFWRMMRRGLLRIRWFGALQEWQRVSREAHSVVQMDVDYYRRLYGRNLREDMARVVRGEDVWAEVRKEDDKRKRRVANLRKLQGENIDMVDISGDDDEEDVRMMDEEEDIYSDDRPEIGPQKASKNEKAHEKTVSQEVPLTKLFQPINKDWKKGPSSQKASGNGAAQNAPRKEDARAHIQNKSKARAGATKADTQKSGDTQMVDVDQSRATQKRVARQEHTQKTFDKGKTKNVPEKGDGERASRGEDVQMIDVESVKPAGEECTQTILEKEGRAKQVVNPATTQESCRRDVNQTDLAREMTAKRAFQVVKGKLTPAQLIPAGNPPKHGFLLGDRQARRYGPQKAGPSPLRTQQLGEPSKTPQFCQGAAPGHNLEPANKRACLPTNRNLGVGGSSIPRIKQGPQQGLQNKGKGKGGQAGNPRSNCPFPKIPRWEDVEKAQNEAARNRPRAIRMAYKVPLLARRWNLSLAHAWSALYCHLAPCLSEAIKFPSNMSIKKCDTVEACASLEGNASAVGYLGYIARKMQQQVSCWTLATTVSRHYLGSH